MTIVPLGLTSDDIDRMSSLGRVEQTTRRTLVALDGPMLVIVVGGYYRIFRNAAFARDVTLGLATRGDVLAPGNAFGDRSAETAAEALVDGLVLLLAPDAWTSCAAVDSELSLRMAVSIARRLAFIQKKIEELSRAGVEGRVASALSGLALDHGTPVAGGIRLDAPLSQEDLARLAGTTRETCSSTVAEFARRGLVRGGRLRGMLVLDLAGLDRLAERGFDEPA